MADGDGDSHLNNWLVNKDKPFRVKLLPGPICGHERVRTEVVQAGYLKKKTLSFCCAIFDLTPNQFRCSNPAQSNPLPWNY